MTDIIKAIAGLIADAQRCSAAPSGRLSHESLANALQALEHLNESPAAMAELRAAVADAERRGAIEIDGVPLVLLRCLLPTDTTGVCHE
ncbi:hypothetical protein SAMN04244579_04321 [Azotobacter beijerinckii]|uniref:Uncharacterized protein n=1 Tax=Azotobacter beijerinckii TaxID=170623 RepID=A0A1H6YNL3_9GAMM|nr:hypothetical protein [Azotobacter beijerinckii]SEJ42871.1 hypothetical protein SAMN04244579_04321 [Azotobacter beijerinckii]